MSLAQMTIEIVIFKLFKNCGHNLERRPALKSSTRLDDMTRVMMVACIFLSADFLLGIFAFSSQGCVQGFF